MKRRVAIIGGGAAGQIAAIKAAEHGCEVAIFEKNEKLGKKLYITGKGRCNLTNDSGRDGFFNNVIRNPRFLYSAYACFNERDIMQFMEKHGTPVKVERGQRVFPVSDKSSDVMRALENGVRAAGVAVRLNTKVSAINTAADEDGKKKVVSLIADGKEIMFDSIILATGGLSYPATGSTGEGLLLAASLGHTVTELSPSLVPLETVETWPRALSGVTLKNVGLTAVKNGKSVYKEQGEMLLTHFGVSGPLVLTASAYLAGNAEGAKLLIDLKPALSAEQLQAKMDRDISENPKKTIEGALSGWLPERLLSAVLDVAGIDRQKRAADTNRAARNAFIEAIKALPLTVKGTRSYAEAVITRGGISVKEVNASTLESKLVRNLFFAGEVLDVDAFTGGFNLQIAWSTGALAGSNA